MRLPVCLPRSILYSRIKIKTECSAYHWSTQETVVLNLTICSVCPSITCHHLLLDLNQLSGSFCIETIESVKSKFIFSIAKSFGDSNLKSWPIFTNALTLDPSLTHRESSGLDAREHKYGLFSYNLSLPYHDLKVLVSVLAKPTILMLLFNNKMVPTK